MELGGYGGASELNFLIHLRIVLSGLSGNLCRRQFCFSFKSISGGNEKKKLRAAVRSGGRVYNRKCQEQDSSCPDCVNCFFGRGGCNRPTTFPLLYHFPRFLARKNAQDRPVISQLLGFASSTQPTKIVGLRQSTKPTQPTHPKRNRGLFTPAHLHICTTPVRRFSLTPIFPEMYCVCIVNRHIGRRNPIFESYERSVYYVVETVSSQYIQRT